MSAATKRPRCDKRGPVAVVEQWGHMHGPCVWFPRGYGRSPVERMSDALRSAASVLAVGANAAAHGGECRVWVCEHGQWSPA